MLIILFEWKRGGIWGRRGEGRDGVGEEEIEVRGGYAGEG